jgi:hypothetical protein
MNATRLIECLDQFRQILPAAVGGIGAADARWRPPDGAWSILEIVTHLADEEESDFRPRLASTLTDPARAWDKIDPEGWARDRKYNEGDLARSLARFLAGRAESIAWLRTLRDPDWSRAYAHPRRLISAGDLLASWAAHDMLHLRQIGKRRYQLVARDADGFDVGYAGTL